MLPAVQVPPFDGDRESFQIHEQRASLWSRVANLGPTNRASALILQMDSPARPVRVTARGDVIMEMDASENISTILRGFVAPETVGPVRQELARFLQFERTDR